MRTFVAIILFFAVPGSLVEAVALSLIQPKDLIYQGAFRLPGVSEGGTDWGWSGSAMTYYPVGDPTGPDDGYPGSLFGTGHDWYQYVSEISIPVPVISSSKSVNELNTADTIQPFHNIRGDLFGEFEIPRVGLEYLPPQGDQTTGKLHFCWTQHLQTSPLTPTHGWCELDLALPESAGPWYIGNYDNYSTTDYIFSIPEDWSAVHAPGKRLATGRYRDGGQGGQGASIFAYAPWEWGNPPLPQSTLPVIPLLLYSTAYWDDPHQGLYTMDRYQHSDSWTGAAWLTAGEKSAVIFVGTKGRGDCWYGNQYGPCLECDNRGWWSTYFDGEIIFYNPDDLAAVAEGSIAATSPSGPFATPALPVEPAPLPAEPPKTLQLRLRGLEKTWVRLSVDRREPVEVFLEPAETVEWEANEEFRLTVGKSHGVSVYLNDEEILLPGELNLLVPDIVLNKVTLLQLEN